MEQINAVAATNTGYSIKVIKKYYKKQKKNPNTDTETALVHTKIWTKLSYAMIAQTLLKILKNCRWKSANNVNNIIETKCKLSEQHVK